MVIERLREISGQGFKEYIWPDLDFPIGQRTGIVLGALVSLLLAILYGISTFKASAQVIELPQEILVLAGPEFMALVKNAATLMNGLAAGSGLYYIYSIGVKESSSSALFLVIWMVLEDISVILSGDFAKIIVFALMTVWSLSAYRATKIQY